MCSQIFTTLVLNVANDNVYIIPKTKFIWFTIRLPVADDAIKFPKDSIAVTHVKKHLVNDEHHKSWCKSRVKNFYQHTLGIQPFPEKMASVFEPLFSNYQIQGGLTLQKQALVGWH